MFKILEKKMLSAQIIEMVIQADRIAAHAEPGQFIILRTDAEAERIPLTIADFDRELGTVTIVFQIVGAATLRLSRMETGDELKDFTGPLGNPSDFVHEDLEELKKKKIIFIGGGVGTAPVYPQAKWFFEHGIRTDVIIGARTKELIMYEDRMREVADVYIATDDGTYGFHGNTCDMLKELYSQGKSYTKCVAIGPTIMMNTLTESVMIAQLAIVLPSPSLFRAPKNWATMMPAPVAMPTNRAIITIRIGNALPTAARALYPHLLLPTTMVSTVL